MSRNTQLTMYIDTSTFTYKQKRNTHETNDNTRHDFRRQFNTTNVGNQRTYEAYQLWQRDKKQEEI